MEFFSFSRLVCLGHRLWSVSDSSRYGGVRNKILIIIKIIIIMIQASFDSCRFAYS